MRKEICCDPTGKSHTSQAADAGQSAPVGVTGRSVLRVTGLGGGLCFVLQDPGAGCVLCYRVLGVGLVVFRVTYKALRTLIFPKNSRLRRSSTRTLSFGRCSDSDSVSDSD